MFENVFIPLDVSSFHNYMLNKYNINIYDIQLEDWSNMICSNYCKNINDNKFCFKKYKKNLNLELCSKCCEKKKIKRESVYIKRKTKLKKNKINESNDSGYYTEIEDNINKNGNNNDYSSKMKENTINFGINGNNYMISPNDSREEYGYIHEHHNEKVYNYKDLKINNKERKNKYIKFGSLKFELNDKNKNLINGLQNLKSENKIINHNINNNITFGSLTFEIKNKLKQKEKENIKIKFEEPDILSDPSNTFNLKLSNNAKDFLANKTNLNKYFQEEEIEKNRYMIFYNDLYYIFVYIINLIFYNSDIKIIKKELYNCLGETGINFYLSQFNLF